MPPKPKVDSPAEPAASGPSVDIEAKFSGVLGGIPYTSIHVRIISSWFNCFTTEAIGLSTSTAWRELPPGEEEVLLSPRDRRTQVIWCNNTPLLQAIDLAKIAPTVYAIIVGCEGLDKVVPLDFLILDCSQLLVMAGRVQSSIRSYIGFDFEFTVACKAPLMAKPQHLRVLTIDIDSLDGYPCDTNQSSMDSLKSTFLFSTLKFGSLERKIFARPKCMAYDSAGAVCHQVCVVIPDKEFDLFKDSLSSTTFVLEIHDEDISRRAFNNRLAEKYTAFVKEGDAGSMAPAVSPRMGAASSLGAKSTSKVGKESQPVAEGPPKRTIVAATGPADERDLLIIDCIESAITATSQLRAHGAARLRLEKLLDTSPDILKLFEQRRRAKTNSSTEGGRLDHVTSYLTDPSLVVVKEEALVEVREAKATKPERWQIPADLSLRSYLNKVGRDSDFANSSKSERKLLFGSSSTGVSTNTSPGVLQSMRPKFERFDTCGTRLSLRAHLYRPVLDLKQILETETLHHKTLFIDPDAPPFAPPMLPTERKEAEQNKLKALAGSKTKFAKTSDHSAPPSTALNVRDPSSAISGEIDKGGSDVVTVSEGTSVPKKSPRGLDRSPRPHDKSPRPKSALKQPSEDNTKTEVAVTKSSTTVDIKPYDRENALKRLLSATPFTRMVFLFRYDNDNVLEALNFAVNAVNMRALPNIQGSVRSYSLSQEEEEAANKGALDIVCGFSIIDDDTRMVVLEGLAGYDKGMESIFIDMPRFNVNDKDLKILSNPEVLFSNRLYTEYGPDVKRIRPRDKLKKLIQKPELYDRKQVDAVCFEALEKIMELRRAPDLQSTKELGMFPPAESLNKMELLYGEAISKADIDGERSVQAKKALKIKQKGGIDNSTLTASYGSESEAKDMIGLHVNTSIGGAVSAIADKSVDTFKRGPSRLAETDCWNDLFVERLAQRDFSHPKHNYVMEQRELRRQAWRRGLNRRAQRDAEDEATLLRLMEKNPELKSGKLHGYAIQSVNIKDMLLSDVRDRLREDKNATYTYSADFQSQTVVLVDEYADRLKIQAAEKAKNVSKKGFVYPTPKTREELISHPKKPSETRIEELRAAYPGEETDFIDSNGSTILPEIRERNSKLKELERQFDNKLSGNQLFGMLQQPQFEREFELSAIGDRTQLPRGRLIGGNAPNPYFWRSVHASGDEGIKLQERIKQEEKDLWRSKVVVDSLDFKVGNFLVKDKTAQWQRSSDILKDEPKTVALKHLRLKNNYETLPIAVMSQGEFVQNASQKALMRAEHKDKFITSAELPAGVTPKDFTRYINMNTDKPKIQTKVYKRKHPPLPADSPERAGPKWGQSV